MEKISIDVVPTKAVSQSLPFCGISPQGECLAINSISFTHNGVPWFPIMGEFHYTRCPAAEWETELEKIHAGGIEIISTYVFWIHHEEKRNEWDFTGQRNLRSFLQLCKKLGLSVWLRIGPWAHGEVRNGGFPDWLQKDKNLHLRTNDPQYLKEVDRFYSKIAEQAAGLLFKDGGPVIGIQIENEYGHCGGEQGTAGMQHMRTLKQLAQRAGLIVPFYTATGWGGAQVVDGEMLPVQGGYADAPWEPTEKALPPSPNYLLTPARNDALIGSDWNNGAAAFTFHVEDYPFLTAELGGGLQVTKRRRPLVSGEDTAALAFCKIGSGANSIGYYMYHGGTNPKGKYSTLQESTATGSYTDVPVMSYDFQAPLGEYGELHSSYRKLKVLHLFLQEFGERLASCSCIFPEKYITNAEDTHSLRYVIRHSNTWNGGFLIVNNHQRLRKMDSHTVRFELLFGQRKIIFPTFQISDHDFGIYPYCLPLGDALLESTNAQPLCRLGKSYVFVCHDTPVFNFSYGRVPILTLTPNQAENAWKFGEKLYLTPGELHKEGDTLRLTTIRTEEIVEILPERKKWIARWEKKKFLCKIQPYRETASISEYLLMLAVTQDTNCQDAVLKLTFTGDSAALYNVKGELIADCFATGTPWRVGLFRLGFPQKVVLKIFRDEQPVYYECMQERLPRLQKAEIIPKYSMLLPKELC